MNVQILLLSIFKLVFVEQQRQHVLVVLHCGRVVSLTLPAGLHPGEEHALQETLQVLFRNVTVLLLQICVRLIIPVRLF